VGSIPPLLFSQFNHRLLVNREEKSDDIILRNFYKVNTRNTRALTLLSGACVVSDDIWRRSFVVWPTTAFVDDSMSCLHKTSAKLHGCGNVGVLLTCCVRPALPKLAKNITSTTEQSKMWRT